jgi:hypothetical protein
VVFIVALTACDAAGSPPPEPPNRPSESAVVPNEVVPIATMASPRAVQSSTRLDDGMILVAGGCSDPGCELGSAGGSTAELFDPDTGEFSPTGDLGGFRDDHASVLLEDGRVLLAGGWGVNGVLDTTEVFAPDEGRFYAGPSMTSPRAGFTAMTLTDGRVLMAGGFLDNEPTTDSADIFDPADGSILATGSLSQPRGAYAAALLPDGRVLFAGGFSQGKVVPTAEIYDPRTGRFSPTGSMAQARYKSAAIPFDDGSVMVIGGAKDVDGEQLYASTEIYDPKSGTFSSGPSMRWPRYKLAGSVVRLDDGSILVAGGAPKAERLDPSGERFSEIPGDLDGERLFLTATALETGAVLLAGGYDGSIVPTDQAWLFTPSTASGTGGG